MTKEMLKKISKSIENISKRKLSIQFSLDGFSFCISNGEDTIYHFSSYAFDRETTSPESLLDHIEQVFKSDQDLQDDFESVLVIHENHLNSFVPNLYFKEDDLKSYLNYNIKTIATDYVTFDGFEQLDFKNVYIPYVNINNFLFQNFGEFDFKHHASVLVEKLISRSENESLYFFVNVRSHAFDIVVIEDQKLLFFNSFEYQTPEDFIYYILFTFEQLKLNPDTLKVHFSGAIDTQSELYQIAYKYIRHLDFVSTSSLILDDEALENHSNFILLG